jgi:LPXTG-motif cell wall-anchored protein
VQYVDSNSSLERSKESGLTFSAVLGGLLVGGSGVILYLKKRNT